MLELRLDEGVPGGTVEACIDGTCQTADVHTFDAGASKAWIGLVGPLADIVDLLEVGATVVVEPASQLKKTKRSGHIDSRMEVRRGCGRREC
jgi:hypothetical protein